MSNASLDRLLAVLTVAGVATGGLALLAGKPASAWVFGSHAVAAGLLTVTVGLKLRSSIPAAIGRRRWGPLVLGLALSLAASASLALGYLWVASGRIVTVQGFTVMTLHAWAGLVLLPILAGHLVPRRWRLLRPGDGAVARAGERLLTRRAALTTLGVVVGGLMVGQGAALLERLGGGSRRFTGSRYLPAGTIPPGTQFLLDGAPPVDAATWRLRAHGRVDRPLELSLAELRAFGETDLVAILDCTSGWAVETTWRGVPLGVVLDAVGAASGPRTVNLRSATGWLTSLPIDEARSCLLATGVAGQPLPGANGAPCRLVAPDQRGFAWVKWLVDIEVT
jgi:DMSO/TMAO reductase YedYZ molybdopterin-dependent catalytic subunit